VPHHLNRDPVPGAAIGVDAMTGLGGGRLPLVVLLVMILATSAACTAADAPGGAAGATPPPADATTDSSDDDDADDYGDDADLFRENPYGDADICALVPVEAVAEAAGGLEPFETESESSPASCRYLFQVAEGTILWDSALTIEMLNSFELERVAAGDSAEDIAGLGDEAWARALTGDYILYVRRDDLVFRVSTLTRPSTYDPAAATRAVADLVLATL